MLHTDPILTRAASVVPYRQKIQWGIVAAEHEEDGKNGKRGTFKRKFVMVHSEMSRVLYRRMSRRCVWIVPCDKNNASSNLCAAPRLPFQGLNEPTFDALFFLVTMLCSYRRKPTLLYIISSPTAQETNTSYQIIPCCTIRYEMVPYDTISCRARAIEMSHDTILRSFIPHHTILYRLYSTVCYPGGSISEVFAVRQVRQVRWLL